jgi:LysM repeat protein
MYTIKQGDTLYAIANALHTTVAAIEAVNPSINPSNLRIGATIKILAGTGGASEALSQPLSPSSQYTIQQGNTFYSIASKLRLPIGALETANQGTDPTKLQIGQTINLPTPSTNQAPPLIPNPGGSYIGYSGPSSNFPNPLHWAPYPVLWHRNSALMSHRNTPQQISLIGQAIEIAARESGIDARIILCLIMQESGGFVGVPDTFNPFRNTGIMQAFDGANFDPRDEAGSILQMVRDGTSGIWRSGVVMFMLL